MDLTRPDWWIDGAVSDAERIAYIARSADCKGMDAAQIADYINEPQVVETRYRDATAAEFCGAMNDASKLLFMGLVKAGDEAATLLDWNLSHGLTVAVDPDRISETVRVLAEKGFEAQTKAAWDVVAGTVAAMAGLKAEAVEEPEKARTFLETLRVLCSQETTIILARASLAEGGYHWDHDVTPAEVEWALSEVSE